jgi:hypothetical protein
MGTPEKISTTNCTLTDLNVNGSFDFNLTHTDAVQVKIKGPYFIGALRLYLRDEKRSERKDKGR